MYRCNICGGTEAIKEHIDETFQIDDKPVLVENIPVTICSRCGDETFSRETTEKIRRMVLGEAAPLKSITINVFAYV
ncbi:MAG: YgiT-type zinc finger protein [Nitrospirae bacterium]|nr:YgiT-type zinc finger protein [Nitrospirota bacterium]